VQVGDEGGREVALRRMLGLDPPPEARHRLGGRQRGDDGDPRERHPQVPQPRHEPRAVELLDGVPAVAGVRVGAGGWQQAEVVVDPQRLRRQPAPARELPDRHRRHHDLPRPARVRRWTDRAACPGDKVKLPERRTVHVDGCTTGR
jgi:hypothetical protein